MDYILVYFLLLVIVLKAKTDDCDLNSSCSYDHCDNWNYSPNTGCCSCEDVNDCWDSSERAECVKSDFSSGCDKKCTCKTGYGWQSTHNKCLSYNNEDQPCTTLADCYDQHSTLTECSGTCQCINNAAWNSDRKRCLVPNDGTSYCSGISLDTCQDNNSVTSSCQGNKCTCRSHYLWSVGKGQCLGANAGSASCSDVSSCYDQGVLADCSGGRCICRSDLNSAWNNAGTYCACKAGYALDTARRKCLTDNNYLVACSKLEDCYDQSLNAKCSGRCTCKTEINAAWNELRRRCLVPNTGIGYCEGNSVESCVDNTERAVCNSGKCSCKENYLWGEGSNRCLGINDGVNYCADILDCHSNTGVLAACIDNKCTCSPLLNGHWDEELNICACIPGFILDTSRDKCLADNDDQVLCSSLLDCYDQNIELAECNGKCRCREDKNAVWNSIRRSCLVPNDGSDYCLGSSLETCLDNSILTAACIDNKCSCNSGYTWTPEKMRCLADNDDTVACNSILDCIDQTVSFAECYKKCRCIQNHRYWHPTRKRCLAANLGAGICTPEGLELCYDNNPIAARCYNGACLCQTDYQWDINIRRCLGHTNGNSFCNSASDCHASDSNVLVDCVDNKCVCREDLNGYSYYGTYCACKTYYALDPDRGKCLTDNLNAYPCSQLEDCYDQNSYLAKCDARCQCRSEVGATWDYTRRRCIGPNDGTIYCEGTSVETCTDNSVVALCDNGKCSCQADYTWESTRKKCIGRNNKNSICSLNYDCYDYIYGNCNLGRCECRGDLTWDDERLKCLCIAGTRQVSYSCIPCSEGYYSNKGSTTCSPCPIGTIPSTSKGECIPCLENTYSNVAGSSTCKECGKGKYQPNRGQSSCLDCHEFCASCTGQATHCLSCIDHEGIKHVDNSCTCKEGEFYYLHNENGKDKCDPCHILCKTCSGPTKDSCTECNTAVANIEHFNGNTCDCDVGYHFDNRQTSLAELCSSCFKFCEICLDEDGNCESCRDIPGIQLVGTKCECVDYRYTLYYDEHGIEDCVPCHPLCTECFGPKSNQCTACDYVAGATLVNPFTCACASDRYYDEPTASCEFCDPLCKTCFGPSNYECYSCSDSFSVSDKPSWCIPNCGLLTNYYRDKDTCISNSFI